MEAVYKLNINELNYQLFEAIKKIFADEEIIISIVSAKKNKKLTKKYSEKILNAVKNIEQGNIKQFTGEEFEELTEKLLKA